MPDPATLCDDVAGACLQAWEAGREAVSLPGGPDEDELVDLLDRTFVWHDLAEQLRAKGA